MFKAHDVDYVSNVIHRCYPDGMDVQVFSLKTLIKSASMTNNPLDLEHVTTFIRDNPLIFSRVHLIAPPELTWPDLGLTLDEKSDFDLISVITKHFENMVHPFSCLDVINFLRNNPGLVKINKNVIRKGYS